MPNENVNKAHMAAQAMAEILWNAANNNTQEDVAFVDLDVASDVYSKYMRMAIAAIDYKSE